MKIIFEICGKKSKKKDVFLPSILASGQPIEIGYIVDNGKGFT